MQIYINGHAWLGQPLDHDHIPYQRHDNKLTQIGDLKTTATLCEKLARRK